MSSVGHYCICRGHQCICPDCFGSKDEGFAEDNGSCKQWKELEATFTQPNRGALLMHGSFLLSWLQRPQSGSSKEQECEFHWSLELRGDCTHNSTLYSHSSTLYTGSHHHNRSKTYMSTVQCDRLTAKQSKRFSEGCICCRFLCAPIEAWPCGGRRLLLQDN